MADIFREETRCRRYLGNDIPEKNRFPVQSPVSNIIPYRSIGSTSLFSERTIECVFLSALYFL